jgi:FkbM family methyltransferase
MSTRIRGVPYRVDPYHISFWFDMAKGRWEPDTLEAIDQHLEPESTYLDVGAYIGPTVLLAARRCRKVYCFEPDPNAFQYLALNLRLNNLRNVVPFCMALTSASGMKTMGSPDGMLGTSKTSELYSSTGPSIEVPGISWPDWLRLAEPGRIDVIKIDIEGGEFDLLPTMGAFLREARPVLLLSIHAVFFPPDVRATRLDPLLAAIGHYPDCRDETGQRLSASEIKATAMARLCQLVFSDGTPEAGVGN